MPKILYFFLISICIMVSCTSNKVQPTSSPSPLTTPLSIATPLPTESPLNNSSQSEASETPNDQILRQAQLIRSRLRYFGEELKTTYTVEKQKALMENVREYIKPAYQEIETISKENKLENNTAIKTILEICNKIDIALSTHDPKALPPILKDFNPAFENLQNSLINKESKK